MNARIRYTLTSTPETPGTLARLFKALILLGVWILVGLAALVTWAHLTA